MKTVTEMIKDDSTGEEKEVSKKVKEMVEKSITVEVNNLVNLVGGDDSKFQELFKKMMKKKNNFSMIVGEDLYLHKNSENIVKLLVLIEKTSPIKITMIPPKSNSLGVALICDLEEKIDGYSIGYNENGDFKISALENGDLDIPALNQQEGTLTNMYKRVVPTNSALEYNGYELNDIANEMLDEKKENTIDWTEYLPIERGFKKVKFDNLPNEYKNNGIENRGYLLENHYNKEKLNQDLNIDKFIENDTLKDQIIYRCNPQRQFNDFTNKSNQIFEEFGAYVSSTKAEKLGNKIKIIFDKENSLELNVLIDNQLNGDIINIPDFDSSKNIYTLFNNRRFKAVEIIKV